MKHVFWSLALVGCIIVTLIWAEEDGYERAEKRWRDKQDVHELRFVPVGARVYYGGREYWVCNDGGELVLGDFWKDRIVHVPPETKVNVVSPIKEPIP